jgi:Tol biopolymer transport system component
VYAEWSPDGRKIIFELDTPDSAQIELMNPDGSGVADISRAPGCCYGQPSFTPDGRHVVYEHYDPVTNEDSVEIMNADGSRPRKLLEPWPGTGGATDPIVSPDGRLLSVIGDDGSTKGPPPALEDANGLFVSRIDGSGFTQLMPFTSDQSLKHDWSPDGRRLLVSTNANWYDPTQSTNIATIRPDGGGLRYITADQGGQNADNAFAGSYSPSGRWIVFRQEHQGRYALERMRPDGSGARIILPFSTTLLPRSSDWGPRARHAPEGDL